MRARAKYSGMRGVVIGLAALIAGLALATPAQGWRRPASVAVSTPDGGLFQACRDGIRFQVADVSPGSASFTAYSPPPIVNPDGSQTGGTIVAQGTVAYPSTPPFRIAEVNETFEALGTHSQRYSGGRLLAPGSQLRLDVSVSDSFGLHEIEDCFLFPLSSSARMVGKGRVDAILVGTPRIFPADYAYIVNCSDLPRTDAPFRIFLTIFVRFSVTTVNGAGCANYSNVATPAAGFDTQEGFAMGTINGSQAVILEWRFVDGGTGGANDSVSFTLTNASDGRVLFQGSGAPPGPFPGSRQQTGINTAQAP